MFLARRKWLGPVADACEALALDIRLIGNRVKEPAHAESFQRRAALHEVRAV